MGGINKILDEQKKLDRERQLAIQQRHNSQMSDYSKDDKDGGKKKEIV